MNLSREVLSLIHAVIRGELVPSPFAAHALPSYGDQGLIKRVVLTGAESTGKTTLAEQLASVFETEWVPEYGRDYTIERYKRLFGDGTATTVPEDQILAWGPEEFTHIAKVQQEMEDLAAERANRVLICDTNAFTTAIWYERYLGLPWPEELRVLAENSPCDLYIIPKPDFPFVQDEIRDGEQIRDWMHNRFIEVLEERSWQYEVIGGSREERLESAVAIIKNLLA